MVGKEKVKVKIIALLDLIIDNCMFLTYCSETGCGDCKELEKEIEANKQEIVNLVERL